MFFAYVRRLTKLCPRFCGRQFGGVRLSLLKCLPYKALSTGPPVGSRLTEVSDAARR